MMYSVDSRLFVNLCVSFVRKFVDVGVIMIVLVLCDRLMCVMLLLMCVFYWFV